MLANKQWNRRFKSLSRRPKGDGMIRKRKDGRWEGRVVIGHKADGTAIQRSVVTKTQKELLEKLNVLKDQYRGVNLTEEYTITLGEWIEKWLIEYAEPTLRPSTVLSYQHYARLITDRIGNIPLNRLTTPTIQKTYNQIKKHGRLHKSKTMGYQLSDSMVRSVHMFLHEVLDAAVASRLLSHNLTKGTVIPKNNHPEMKVFDDEAYEKFIMAIENEPVWYDFFYVEIMTGLRRGEICTLKWSDFDVRAKTLSVNRTATVDLNRQVIVGATKTSTGKRVIRLPESVYQLLLKRKEEAMFDWIFPSLNDPTTHVAPNSAYQRLKDIIKENDLPNIRFHDLRHTFATHALKNGVNAKTLSGILGHTNASFTLDTYTHVTVDMKKNASTVVGNFMANILGEDLNICLEEEKKDKEQ